MNRFVLLRHNTTETQYHWDFLFEETTACKTFSVAQEAAEELQRTGAVECFATQLADHRLAYLDYEGPVSGNRGYVERLDHGTYEVVGDEIYFEGNHYSGKVDLRDVFLMIFA